MFAAEEPVTQELHSTLCAPEQDKLEKTSDPHILLSVCGCWYNPSV